MGDVMGRESMGDFMGGSITRWEGTSKVMGRWRVDHVIKERADEHMERNACMRS